MGGEYKEFDPKGTLDKAFRSGFQMFFKAHRCLGTQVHMQQLVLKSTSLTQASTTHNLKAFHKMVRMVHFWDKVKVVCKFGLKEVISTAKTFDRQTIMVKPPLITLL